jgi:hypothetical protein
VAEINPNVVISDKKKKKEARDALEDIVETLLDKVEELQIGQKESKSELEEIRGMFQSKATESALAFYLQKISEGLHRECGEKPYKNTLGEKSMLDEHYLSDDSLLLKASVEKMVDKFQIIGMNLITQKKFK